MDTNHFEIGDIYNQDLLIALINVSHSFSSNEQIKRELFTGMAWAHLQAFLPSVTRLVDALEMTERSPDTQATTQNHCKCSSCTSAVLFPSSRNFVVDVFILTVKEVELAAVLSAFGVAIEGDERPPHFTDRSTTLPIWFITFEKYRIGIGLCNTDGLSESAVIIGSYAKFVSFNYVCLVGMAGGSQKIGLGDVVIATLLHDYDRRVEEGTILFTQKDPSDFVNRIPERRFVPVTCFEGSLQHYSFPTSKLAVESSRLLPDLARTHWLSKKFKVESSSLPEDHSNSRIWEIHKKPILCGGALVEKENAFKAIKRHYDNEAVAVDMESYGFAYWCKRNMAPESWLVLRGISDHCNQEQGFVNASDNAGASERRKDWQFYATFRAAYVLRHLLEAKEFGPGASL